MSRSERFRVRVDQAEHEVEVPMGIGQGPVSVDVDGRAYVVIDGPDGGLLVREAGSPAQHAVWLAPGRAPQQAAIGADVFALEIRTAQQAALDEALAAGTADDAGSTVSAPMPGRVVRVLVEPGDDVAVDDPLVIVEAMKMENEVRAPTAGQVLEVAVAAGETVESGQALCEIGPHADAS